MRKILLSIILLMLVAGIPANVKAVPVQGDGAVVHAALFWTNGCPYCMQALTETLPPIQEKYNSQLSILLVELVSQKDIDNLYSLGSSLGFTKEQVAVPFLLINHTALIGADLIGSQLPGIVDQYISSGGIEYPDFPQLDEMLPRGIVFTEFNSSAIPAQQTSTDVKSSGMALAWAIMIFMGIALVLAIVLILRAFNGKPIREINRWFDLLIPILSIIGLGASIYLTYVEVTHTRALCGPVGDCNAVQSSPYAKLFGFLPIGLVGAVGYIAIIISWLWRRYRTDSFAKIAGPAIFGMALFGTLFSIYLTYLEIFVIHAACIWCLASAVIMTILMLLSLPPLTQWLAISDEYE